MLRCGPASGDILTQREWAALHGPPARAKCTPHGSVDASVGPNEARCADTADEVADRVLEGLEPVLNRLSAQQDAVSAQLATSLEAVRLTGWQDPVGSDAWEALGS